MQKKYTILRFLMLALTLSCSAKTNLSKKQKWGIGGGSAAVSATELALSVKPASLWYMKKLAQRGNWEDLDRFVYNASYFGGGTYRNKNQEERIKILKKRYEKIKDDADLNKTREYNGMEDLYKRGMKEERREKKDSMESQGWGGKEVTPEERGKGNQVNQEVSGDENTLNNQGNNLSNQNNSMERQQDTRQDTRQGENNQSEANPATSGEVPPPTPKDGSGIEGDLE